MGKIKDVLQKFNKARFIRYFIFSIIFLLILVLIGDSDLTHSRYETDTNLKLTPNLLNG